jgi:hypothetical protein
MQLGLHHSHDLVYTCTPAGDHLFFDWPVSQTESLWRGTFYETRVVGSFS